MRYTYFDFIKFLILFIYKFVIVNPGRFICIALASIFWSFAGTFSESKVVLNVVDSAVINKDYLYTYTTISDNKVVYDIYQSKSPAKLINSNIEYNKYSDTNIIFWVLFCISIVALLIFMSNESWDYDVAFDFALSWFIKCDLEDSSYIYYAFGKLITKQNRSISHNYMQVGSIRYLKMLPDYESIKEKRERLLNKIGI